MLQGRSSLEHLSTADLAERIALARRERAGGAELAEMTAELLRRVPKQERARPFTPLDAAREYADVRRFSVPDSHRRRLGQAVTAAKRIALQATGPLNAELLRAQQDFNHQLLAAIEEALGQKSGATVRTGGGRSAPPWRRGYVAGATRLLRSVLDRQRQWNEAAEALLASYVRGEQRSPREASAAIAELDALCDPLGGDLSAAVRATAPLWREVFRIQALFNREVMLVLGGLIQGRPPASLPRKSDYARWIRDHEPEQLAETGRQLETLNPRPLFSIVVPAYQTPPAMLRECIESVRAQLYPNWELCIVDDASPDSAVRRVLSKWAKRDPRIRWRRLEANAGIAGATNAAIELARGEWVAFLDHDDTLAPHALAEFALRIAREPELEWLYSDEDRLSSTGERHTPAFKPDWSPDLLRSTNYICHFVAARAERVKRLKLRTGFDGSQDHDFLLRLSEETGRVAHVPKVLYHWRAWESFSRGESGLRKASVAGVRAVTEHLQRCGEQGEVTDPLPAQYRVKYAVQGQPKVSIIVPFKDRPELLERLVRTLTAVTTYSNYELLLVSNNSTQPRTFELLERFTDPKIRKLTWDHPFSYPAINNWAAREATGELLLFLNNDMEVVDPRWLEELISNVQRPGVGMVGPKLLFPDGTIQHAGVVVGLHGGAGHPFWGFPNTTYWTALGHADWSRNYLAVTSACVMLRKDFFEALGGFDERFRLCGSDVVLGIRSIQAGKRVVYTAGTHVIHHESASRGSNDIPAGDLWESFLAYRRYFEQGDPFYNPNLTLLSTNCALREHAASGLELAFETLARAATAP